MVAEVVVAEASVVAPSAVALRVAVALVEEVAAAAARVAWTVVVEATKVLLMDATAVPSV